MNKTICVKCSEEMNCDKMGVKVVVRSKMTGDILEIWSADRYKCKGCGYKIIPDSKFAQEPIYCEYKAEGINPEVYVKKLKKEGKEFVEIEA